MWNVTLTTLTMDGNRLILKARCIICWVWFSSLKLSHFKFCTKVNVLVFEGPFHRANAEFYHQQSNSGKFARSELSSVNLRALFVAERHILGPKEWLLLIALVFFLKMVPFSYYCHQLLFLYRGQVVKYWYMITAQKIQTLLNSFILLNWAQK